MHKAIFIDRDGTLIKDVPYNANPSLIVLEGDAAEMLQSLKRRNYLLIIISNQSGVALGYYTEDDVNKMHERIQQMLCEFNVSFDAFYYCPHLKEGIIEQYAIECDCRKPKPGLLYKASNDFNINLNESWMIGDILNDVEAGNTAGCKTILIDNGNETEWVLNEHRTPTYKAENLRHASEIILRHEMETV